MTGQHGLFKSLNEEKRTVKIGNGKSIQIEGRGTVNLEVGMNKQKTLDEVQYARALGYNLVSVGQLMKAEYTLIFDDNACTIKHNASGKQMCKVEMAENNVFPLHVKRLYDEHATFTAEKPSESTLWHLRQEEENESQINFRKNNSDDVERKRNSRNQNKVEFDINKVRCYNCNNFGHYASDCRKSNHGGKQANLVQEEQEDDEPTLLMLQIDDSDTQKICEDIEEYVHVKEDGNKKDKIQFPKIGGGDYLMFDVLEDVGSVQVDDVVPGQDVGHGGVHEHDDDDLEENEYGEGDLQIDHLDQLADDTFDNGVPADRSGEVIANVAEGDAEDIDRVVFAAH
ncbi:hypothetical protein E3N88_43247 [Mikania micrantha]|uniref:CCHC-type domain-containing protein n=1 Tax=Mikania micrantha TaxID=192012 RepID=A0A5N6LFL4_9ASTR|nr:hypothetical protein E3N88_43247 [Mikania micrantha]